MQNPSSPAVPFCHMVNDKRCFSLIKDIFDTLHLEKNPFWVYGPYWQSIISDSPISQVNVSMQTIPEIETCLQNLKTKLDVGSLGYELCIDVYMDSTYDFIIKNKMANDGSVTVHFTLYEKMKETLSKDRYPFYAENPAGPTAKSTTKSIIKLQFMGPQSDMLIAYVRCQQRIFFEKSSQ